MNNYKSKKLGFLQIRTNFKCQYLSVDLWTQYANFISPLSRHWTIRAQKAIEVKHMCVLLETCI